MSVTNCPATSSMTTNCGSFRPEARATSVAAGIPMRVTAAAATMVAEVRLATDICELANAHTITVANDPHVPGPGLRRPAPKKVATSVAQSGGRDAPATAGGSPALLLFAFSAILLRLGRRLGYLLFVLRRAALRAAVENLRDLFRPSLSS